MNGQSEADINLNFISRFTFLSFPLSLFPLTRAEHFTSLCLRKMDKTTVIVILLLLLTALILYEADITIPPGEPNIPLTLFCIILVLFFIG
ncbi:hypothetical protein P8452_49763 [Trifolium repens]|nr:hypothetical protein P8452_49763 [Trifolium repens]